MATEKRKRRIGYISPQIPKVEFPLPIEGERYEVLVPDTLDIAERAKYAIHCLTNVSDPEADYEIWWHVLLNHKPPIMLHDFHDLNVQYKFMEALPLLRMISGSDINLDVDRVWAEALLHMQGEDGIVYYPVEGRLWARYHAGWLDECGGGRDDGVSPYLASTIAQGGYLAAMAIYYMLTKDEVWKQRIQLFVDGLTQLMVYKDNYCYFPVMGFNPGFKVSPDMPMLDPQCKTEAGGACAGWIIHGLSQAYLATGYEPAFTLAGKLAVYLKDYSGCYDKEGRFTGIPHPHLHLRPIVGLLEYALITKNQEMIEFCKKAYECTKSCGSPIIGFFPAVPGPDYCSTFNATPYQAIQRYFKATMEGCTIADIVVLAIMLSQAGVADYWDDAERYIRNMFAEVQIMRTDFINRLPVEAVPISTFWEQDKIEQNPEFWTTERVIERNIGACMSFVSPNDFLGITIGSPDRPTYDHLFIMHCCTGNYARALAYIWNNILNFDGETLRVNLLLNRASPWADIESYIPYEGRVDIKVKKACKLSVRTPEWVKLEEIACKVNDVSRELSWNGRYAQVCDVKPGDVVVLTFPIAERTVKETICGVEYTMIIKGNTVVYTDPPGKYYPLYRRDHYQENKVRWIKRARFVSSKPFPPSWHY